MREYFKKYLISRGYKELTPTGLPSTVYDYIKRIDFVCDQEHLDWDRLKETIDCIVPLYNYGGAKEALGNKSHRSVINALLRFQEFAKGY